MVAQAIRLRAFLHGRKAAEFAPHPGRKPTQSAKEGRRQIFLIFDFVARI
jgi:hypothetical protein